MKVSLRWLRAVAPELELSPAEVAERLAARGAPVEELIALSEGLEGIVVAEVEAVAEHPDADRLRVCQVSAGGEVRQVVCGAPNVEAGGLYPFAPVGATLPGGAEIGEVELRGVRSEGMLCSAAELELGSDHSGLLELPGGLEPGSALVDALELRDHRLDVEVTANRGDLLSHVGVAREVAPRGDGSIVLPPVPDAPLLDTTLVTDAEEASAGGVTVRIEDPDLCPRYLGAVVRGVEVGPSPPWLQARLRAAGARPINNVVDATNYVLLELGQPLHAFDLDTLAESSIVVRRARPEEESFTTLDGEERELDPDVLMICDAREPVAVAGVMGGLDSEVTEMTTDVLLECALFDPANIRRTRRAMNVSTDASYRFERGVDPSGMERALHRALEIVAAAAGGTIEPAIADCRPGPWSPRRIELRLGRVEHVLGVSFDSGRVRDLLGPLGFRVVSEEDGRLEVEVPGWRDRDVTREVDLIEEIARSHGYDRFPDDLGGFRPGTVPDHPLFRLEGDVRDLLVARGFFETQSPAFVPAAEGEVRVQNPVSKEEDHLRRDLLPSLLRRVEHNWSHGVRDVRLFEIGTSFRKMESGDPPHEETRVALVMTGRAEPVHWQREGRAFDVWDLKAVFEEVTKLARHRSSTGPGAPAGKAMVEEEGFVARDAADTVVGWAGRVSPERVDAPAWADPVWGLELALPAVPEPAPVPVHQPLPPYPGVDRDLALLVPESVAAGEVARGLRSAAGPHLHDVELFDLYVGEGVPDGVRSLAFRLRFRSMERTLTDEEVDEAVHRAVEYARSEFDVEPRDARG